MTTQPCQNFNFLSSRKTHDITGPHDRRGLKLESDCCNSEGGEQRDSENDTREGGGDRMEARREGEGEGQ